MELIQDSRSSVGFTSKEAILGASSEMGVKGRVFLIQKSNSCSVFGGY